MEEKEEYQQAALRSYSREPDCKWVNQTLSQAADHVLDAAVLQDGVKMLPPGIEIPDVQLTRRQFGQITSRRLFVAMRSMLKATSGNYPLVFLGNHTTATKLKSSNPV